MEAGQLVEMAVQCLEMSGENIKRSTLIVIAGIGGAVINQVYLTNRGKLIEGMDVFMKKVEKKTGREIKTVNDLEAVFNGLFGKIERLEKAELENKSEIKSLQEENKEMKWEIRKLQKEREKDKESYENRFAEQNKKIEEVAEKSTCEIF